MSALRFDLRQAMQDYEKRTGIHLTYEVLAQRTAVSVDTLKSMATREGYNPNLKLIAALGEAMKCDPRTYLVWNENEK